MNENSLSAKQEELLSLLHHELRTPLTSLAGALTLVLNLMPNEIPTEALNLINIAHRNSQRLCKIIDGHIELGIISTDALNPKSAAIDAAHEEKRAISDKTRPQGGSGLPDQAGK